VDVTSGMAASGDVTGGGEAQLAAHVAEQAAAEAERTAARAACLLRDYIHTTRHSRTMHSNLMASSLDTNDTATRAENIS